mgnify:CR=1 FL=1
MSSIIIGTAQFGMDYGITNTRGKIPDEEVHEILRYLVDQNILKLDTASGYGDAEEILGRFTDIDKFLITTKVSIDSDETIKVQIKRSLEKLGVSSIDTVLIHDYSKVKSEIEKQEVILALEELKNTGLCHKIGVSVYEPWETKGFDGDHSIDVVQLPLNLFNQVFIQTGEFNRLQGIGIEIQIRSVFMQGVTLAKRIPNKLIFAVNDFEFYLEFLNKHGVSQLDASLGFVKSLPGEKDIIVAVDRIDQLLSIVESMSKSLNPEIDFSKLSSSNIKFITPKLWS